MFLSAFGASKPISAAVIPDPFWANVVFLQTCDGLTDGTFPGYFPAYLPNQKTGISSTIQQSSQSWSVSSTPSVFGKALKNSSTLSFGSKFSGNIGATLSGQFTFEFSIYRAGTLGWKAQDSLGRLYDSGNTGPRVEIVSTSGNQGQVRLVGDTFVNGPLLDVDTWYDIAVTRDAAGAVRFFVNGVLYGQTTQSAVITGTDLAQGFSVTSVSPFTYAAAPYSIDEIRITNICRYTANYTPSHPFPAQ